MKPLLLCECGDPDCLVETVALGVLIAGALLFALIMALIYL